MSSEPFYVPQLCPTLSHRCGCTNPLSAVRPLTSSNLPPVSTGLFLPPNRSLHDLGLSYLLLLSSPGEVGPAPSPENNCFSFLGGSIPASAAVLADGLDWLIPTPAKSSKAEIRGSPTSGRALGQHRS